MEQISPQHKNPYTPRNQFMTTTFQRKFPPSRPMPGPAFWLLFRGNELLVQEQGNDLALLLVEESSVAPLEPGAVQFLGTLNDTPCMAGEVNPEREVPAGWRAVGIRA